MLNLRQLNKADNTQTNSDAHHFSRFSMDFRVSSGLLGNIGEPLDHGQSERLHEDEPEDHEATDDEHPRGTRDLESAGPVAGPSGTPGVDESDAPLGNSWLVAGPSGTRSDEASLRGATLNDEPFCVRDGRAGDAPRLFCEDVTESFSVNDAGHLRYMARFSDGCVTSKAADKSY